MGQLGYPLLPNQKRLWFLKQLELYGQDDIISVLYQSPTPLDQVHLQRQMAQLVAQHEALLTGIVTMWAKRLPQKTSRQPFFFFFSRRI